MGAGRYTNSPKVDAEATDGLDGTEDSLAYRVHEIEKHFHNCEDWFGVSAVPPDATNRADDITDGSLQPFAIDAGNNTWGNWVQILGTADTPNRADKVKFDLHKLLIVDADSNNKAIFIQISAGASGDGGVSNGDYTTIAYMTATGAAAEGPVELKMGRIDVGTKVWARAMAPGVDTLEIDFYFGIHEYDG